MIYFLETELNINKPVYISLQKVLGLGHFHSVFFCKKLGISLTYKLKNLSKNQLQQLNYLIRTSNVFINSDLQKQKRNSLKLLIDIKSYRGLRKLKGFPVRGQRTRSNGKTAKKLNKFF